MTRAFDALITCQPSAPNQTPRPLLIKPRESAREGNDHPVIRSGARLNVLKRRPGAG